MCNMLELSGLELSGWGDLLSFSVPGEAEKIAGLRFARGGSILKLMLWTSDLPQQLKLASELESDP